MMRNVLDYLLTVLAITLVVTGVATVVWVITR